MKFGFHHFVIHFRWEPDDIYMGMKNFLMFSKNKKFSNENFKWIGEKSLKEINERTTILRLNDLN